MEVVALIKLCILLYLAIMTHFIVFKIIKESKYGKTVFKVNSLDYRKGIKGKKIYKLNVAPFVDNNKVYLPIKDVAKSLGYKNTVKNEKNLFEINRAYKKILINNDENIVITVKGLNERCYKLRDTSKQVNGELMVSVNTIIDIFDVDYEIKENGEILLK